MSAHRRLSPAKPRERSTAQRPARATHLLQAIGNSSVQRLARSVEAKTQEPSPRPAATNSGGVYSKKSGTYSYVLSGFSPDTGGRIDVFVAGEDRPVGYAMFSIETHQLTPRPAANAEYTDQHVASSRAGKVAHLTHFYNLTLTRPGPADIYSGFAVPLLKQVEELSRGAGAWLIYLEPATNPVRVDPNTNEMEGQASEGFYLEKCGYGRDLEQAAHNSRFFIEQAKTAQMTHEETAQFVANLLDAAALVKTLG
jgi:hypothetical protein